MNRTFSTLIIDDEAPARMRLRILLASFGEINVVGEAKEGTEAVSLIDALTPDLVFLDIKMPGLNGFEVLKQIRHTPYVIFCTAYDDYALQAFETKSIDYLVKPVETHMLKRAIDKLYAFSTPNMNTGLIEMVQQMLAASQHKEVSTLPVKKSDRVIFIKLADVTHLQATDKYVEVNTHRGEKHLTDQSLRFLETRLPKNFARIHRASIINTHKIKEVRKHFSGRYVFVLDDVAQTVITSGRSYHQTVKGMFDL